MNGLKMIGRWRWKHHEQIPGGATTHTMRSPEVARDKVRHVKRIMLQDEDTNTAVCLISIERAGDVTEIYTHTCTTKAVWYPVLLEVVLFGEERLRYDWSSGAAANDLFIREIGETYEAPEGLF